MSFGIVVHLTAHIDSNAPLADSNAAATLVYDHALYGAAFSAVGCHEAASQHTLIEPCNDTRSFENLSYP